MQKKKDSYDAIIIGSGIGGLSIASLLSRDRKVLVLEKNNNFGGYCTSFIRDHFNFEVAVQALNGLGDDSLIRNILEDSGALQGVDCLMPKNLYRTIFPDYDLIVPQENLNRYKELLFSLFPQEKQNIIQLFDVMKSLYAEMKRFHLFYRKRAIKKSPFTLKYYKRSFEELIKEFISNKKLQAIISQYWMYRGLPPSKLSASIFSYIWYDYTANGSYYPREGMGALIRNLIKTIKTNGGDVISNAEVSKLYVKKDRITQLQLKTGELMAAKIFISNIDVFKTFDMIEGKITDDTNQFIEKFKQNILSISAFKIYLGLSTDVKRLGIEDYEIFVNPLYDMEQMYWACVKYNPDKMPFSITIYSNLTDKFCKKGQSVISIGMLSGYDFWEKLPKTDYKKKKAELANIIISKCEQIIPNLRKYIKTKVIATPLTMERYTGNSKGSAYGWNKKRLEDEIRFMNPTTPIKNLMLSSQWTKIGGGVAGVLLSSDRAHTLAHNTK